MKTPSFFSQLIARFTSETPIFFKKIVIFMGTVGAAGLLLKGVDATALRLPWDLGKIANFMIAVGGVGTVVAKLTTTNPDLQAQGGSNVVLNATPPAEPKEAPVSPPITPQSIADIQAGASVSIDKSDSIGAPGYPVSKSDGSTPTFTTDDKQ